MLFSKDKQNNIESKMEDISSSGNGGGHPAGALPPTSWVTRESYLISLNLFLHLCKMVCLPHDVLKIKQVNIIKVLGICVQQIGSTVCLLLLSSRLLASHCLPGTEMALLKFI